MKRHEKPLKRRNPGGGTVWVARWTDKHGRRRFGWKSMGVPGTYELKREAQAAIERCYELDTGATESITTVETYFLTWLQRHPRSPRTERSYDGRVRSVLDVLLSERPFREWPMAEINSSHAVDIVDDLLRVQGRAASGAKGVIVVLSAMWQDAITDLKAPANPFFKVKVRANDPRVQKRPRKIRTYSWEQMHGFAKACGTYEPMIRMLSDCGLRLGELLPLERADLFLGEGRCGDEDCRMAGPHLHVRRTAHEGSVTDGTKTDHGEADAGREVPVPPELEAMLRAMPKRIDTKLLFCTQTGRMWRESNFYRDIWRPARRTVPGMEAATPHELRHSWVSHLRAAGIDPADLADMAGHGVDTATAHYTHAMRRSAETVRGAVGR